MRKINQMAYNFEIFLIKMLIVFAYVDRKKVSQYCKQFLICSLLNFSLFFFVRMFGYAMPRWRGKISGIISVNSKIIISLEIFEIYGIFLGKVRKLLNYGIQIRPRERVNFFLFRFIRVYYNLSREKKEKKLKLENVF